MNSNGKTKLRDPLVRNRARISFLVKQWMDVKAGNYFRAILNLL